MKTGVKETLCTHCTHRKICKLMDQTLAAQKAVDEATAQLGHTADGYSMKRVVDMDWLTVTLYCIHYECIPHLKDEDPLSHVFLKKGDLV